MTMARKADRGGPLPLLPAHKSLHASQYRIMIEANNYICISVTTRPNISPEHVTVSWFMSMAALAGVLCESDVVCWCNVGEGGADMSAMFDNV